MEHWQKKRFIPRVKSANMPPLRVDYARFTIAGSRRRRAYTKTEWGTNTKIENRELKRSKICNIYFRPVADQADFASPLGGATRVFDCLSASAKRQQTKILDIAMEKLYIYEHNCSLPSGGHDIRSAMLLTMAQFNRPLNIHLAPESYGSPRNGEDERRQKRPPRKPLMECLQYKKTPDSMLHSLRDSNTLNSYCRRGTPTMCEYCEVLGPSSCNKCLRKLNQHIADDVNRSSPVFESTLKNIVAPKLAKLMDRGNRTYTRACQTRHVSQCQETVKLLPNACSSSHTSLTNNDNQR